MGTLLGWLGFMVLNANEGRGVLASMLIGAAGALAGGIVISPFFGAVVSDSFSFLSMVVAAGSAMVLLAVANMISNRFNF